MIRIRTALASLLTAAALVTGGVFVGQHEASANTTVHSTHLAGPVRCCFSVVKI